MVTLLQWHRSLQSTDMDIASENGCERPDISGKKLKDLIMEEIPNVVFCKPRKVNESERVVSCDLPLQKQKFVMKASVMSSKFIRCC